ncbi:hypothetical protein [Saliniramus sp.]|uniref:hypothetical protein n=1 Tax=Saliniramus sp. TaxID=2986772 RepID=UPI002B8E344E|nr:hypothetical protein [Saliniramus sp.]HMB11426.1 hypothetical protein [Saliniramus sp.]
MNIGAISNPLAAGGESSLAPADKGFSLDLGKTAAAAPEEARIASSSEQGDPSDMEARCADAFNRLMRDVNALFDLLARDDPSLEAKIDDLDLRINALINFCGDALPHSAMSDLRGLRELIDAMRGALGFDADQSQSGIAPQVNWNLLERLAHALWEGLQRVAPLLGGGPANQPAF